MNTLRRFACLLLMLVLLLGGYPPSTHASAPARLQSIPPPAVQNQLPLAPLAGLESGIDCSCSKTGQFRSPVSGDAPEVTGDDTSPNGIYTLQVTGSGILYFTIRKVADNSIVLSFSNPAGAWGFSPDDHRFAYWYVYGGVTYISLYNLAATGGGQLTWNTSGAYISVSILFSPTGKYFFLATLTSSNHTSLLILDAQSAAQRYTDQFTFAIIPGGPGDSFGLARYGFSPDSKDRTFVYSFAVDQNTVSWDVVSLKTGTILIEQNITDIAAFWQFSQCGDRLGLVREPDAGHVQTGLYQTLDGGLVDGSSHTVGIATVVMTTTLASHLALIGGSTYTLGSNTAPAACPVVPVLDTINLSSASVIGGNPVNGTVALNVPAPTGGTVISLASNKPGVATVPSTITVLAGNLTASFSVTTFEVSSTTDVIITASLSGDTVSETLHVLVEQPVLTEINTSGTTIYPGETLTVNVWLAANAPVGGVDVSLSSSHPDLIQMPPEVHIPAGKPSASIILFPVEVSAYTNVILSASLNSVTKTAQVTLAPNPPELKEFRIQPSVVKGGNWTEGFITLSKAVPEGMMVEIDISHTYPDFVHITSNKLRMYGGDLSEPFGIWTYGVSEAVTATFTITLEESVRTSSLQIQPADLSEFRFDAICGVVPKDPTAKASIAGYPLNSVIILDGSPPSAGAVVHLESSDPDLIQVPATVTLYSFYNRVDGFPTGEVAAPTLVTLTASYRDVELQMPITLTTVPSYTVTTLPFLPVAINDAGQIAGESFIMENGVVTDVNLLVGGTLDIIDMNEDGDLLSSGQLGGLEGFYYIDKATVSTIYSFEPGAFQALYARGMNDQDEVVGEVSMDKWYGFRWQAGVTMPLESTSDRLSTSAVDINNYGVIVGNSLKYDPPDIEYIQQADRWVSDLLTSMGLDSLPDPYSEAIAVNDAGTVAIQSDAIYLWKAGVITQLSLPKPDDHGVMVRALNEEDEVLISAYYYNDQEERYIEPMIHNQHGTYLLNCAAGLEEDWRISDVTDLNNLGQIVGTMEGPGEGEVAGILLNPSGQPSQPGLQIFLPLVQR